MRDDRERIIDILEEIERIEKYAASGRDVFEREELIQVWMVHHLQMIGEAARSSLKLSGNSILKFHGQRSLECAIS